MRKKCWIILLVFLLAVAAPVSVASAEPVQEYEVYLGGMPLGIDLVHEGLVVVGYANLQTEQGAVCPAKQSGVEVGDVLVRVGGETVHTRYDVQRQVDDRYGDDVDLDIVRDGQAYTLSVEPMKDADGQYRLGLYLKDGVQGIGTLTYVRCDSLQYGALGHGIEDADTGMSVAPYKGKLYASDITRVQKGVRGAPGQLVGTVGDGPVVGSISQSNSFGVYGTMCADACRGMKRVKIGTRAMVQEGDAVIVCATEGQKPQCYAVRITRCRPQDTAQAKGLSLRVTDTRLLAKTGGIVQGMSGSPILQNGRLVGAVTHVTVDNPAQGYGIYIEFMLAENG